jgi:hypothetical protein
MFQSEANKRRSERFSDIKQKKSPQSEMLCDVINVWMTEKRTELLTNSYAQATRKNVCDPSKTARENDLAAAERRE